MRFVKKTIRRTLALGGYEIRRRPASVPQPQTPKVSPIARWLRTLDIRTALDVGAHEGESVTWIHYAVPDAQIFSFEPLPECLEILREKTRHLSNCQVIPVAVGDHEETKSFLRSSYSPASSILEMTDLLQESVPKVAGTTEEIVQVRTLDSLADELHFEPNILLKIDTQGYEDRVLRGAHEVLRNTVVIVCEVNYLPLYQKQASFDDLYRFLWNHGFVFRGVWMEGRRSRDTGLEMYSDIVFVRRNFATT